MSTDMEMEDLAAQLAASIIEHSEGSDAMSLEELIRAIDVPALTQAFEQMKQLGMISGAKPSKLSSEAREALQSFIARANAPADALKILDVRLRQQGKKK